MKAVKIISAILLIVILFVAEAFTMGLFAVDKAVSKDSVQEAMTQSDIVSELINEALTEQTVNNGGEYGDMINAVFRTTAMNDFLSDYLTALINTELYGDRYEEIADDELMAAFSAGIDEVNEAGTYSISPMEEELIKQAMQQEVPDLTAELNTQAKQYDSLEGDVTDRAMKETMGEEPLLNPFVKVILVIVCLLLCAGIAALCRKSKLGFLWCGIVTALLSLIYRALYGIAAGMTGVSATDKMENIMVANGFDAVSMAGFVISALFLAAFIILKIVFRNKNKNTSNENAFHTENTHM